MCVFSTDPGQPEFGDVFYNFSDNLAGSFTKGFGLYHLSAIGLSYGLVKSDVDWNYYSYMQDNQLMLSIGSLSVFTGGLVPLAVPLYCYFHGKSNNDNQLTYSALAMGQSVIISLMVSSTYKAVTGRPRPDVNNNTDKGDNFHFGFMRRGIFEGWPSGHTMNAFAMAGVLTEMYSEDVSMKVHVWIYAFFIGLGVSTNIHWLSDCVAGALIGYSIGKTVGRSFRKLYEGDSGRSAGSFYFTPNGLGYTFKF